MASSVAGAYHAVVLVDLRPHLPHPRPLFLGRHLERVADRFGHVLDVVRIDGERIAELARRPGESAQDQYAAPVPASGDELSRLRT
jgi:hypothetical protein